jgi:histidine triad (HIT) family protein
MADCPFCRIAAGDLPADIVLSSDDVVAFRDINPQAPVHVLVVPRRHVANLAELTTSDRELAGRLMETATRIAQQEGVAESGYRIVINTGPHAGQAVHHLHVHVLGGRPMAWPPG